jgi:predicted tellurium resistance membrane protein TerC
VPLLVFGLLVSIPLVIAGSQIILKLIERFPLIILAGGGLLGWIAGKMLVEDTALTPWIDANAAWLEWVGPIVGVAIVLSGARWQKRRAVRDAR